MTQPTHNEGEKSEPTETRGLPDLIGDDVPTSLYIGKLQSMMDPDGLADPELKKTARLMLKAIINAALERQLKEGAHGRTINVSEEDIRIGLTTLTFADADDYEADLDAAYQDGKMTLSEIKEAVELAGSVRAIDEIYTEEYFT